MFTFSRQLKVWSFHVVVLQRDKKNLQWIMTHVYNCSAHQPFVKWRSRFLLLTLTLPYQPIRCKTKANSHLSPRKSIFFFINGRVVYLSNYHTEKSHQYQYPTHLPLLKLNLTLTPTWYQLTVVGCVVCSEGVLLGRVNVKKLAIVYSTGHVWFGDRGSGEGRGRGKVKYVIFTSPTPTPTPSLFLTVTHPLGKNFFLSPAFRCN